MTLNFCRFALRKILVLTELALGYLHYHFSVLTPHSNSSLAVVPSKAQSTRQRISLNLDARLINILTITPYIHIEEIINRREIKKSQWLSSESELLDKEMYQWVRYKRQQTESATNNNNHPVQQIINNLTMRLHHINETTSSICDLITKE